MISAIRYHDISCGHRVCGHESKCAMLHGHNYRIHFEIEPEIVPSIEHPEAGLDKVGRVLDFSAIKEKLCEWLERHWDHKFLIWKEDPWADALWQLDRRGVVFVPFNPTAENMGLYLINVIAPLQLSGTGTILTSVTIEETRKCSAKVSI